MLELYRLGEKIIDSVTFLSQFLDLQITLPHITWVPGAGELVPNDIEIVFFTFSVFEWLFGFGLLVILVIKLYKFIMDLIPFT